MPNPNWLPIIGNSFSDVGSQIAGWAGFNRGVEEGNITRRMAQDDAINRYNANVWKIQHDADEQARQQAIHDRDLKLQIAMNRDKDAQQRYQFEQQMGLERERIGAAQDAVEAKQKQRDDDLAKRIEAQNAKALQVQVLHANAALDKAIAEGKYDPTGAKASENDKVLASIVSGAALKSGIAPSVFFDKKAGRFTSQTPSLYGPEFWNNPPAEYRGGSSTGTSGYQFPSAVLNPAPAGIDWSPVQNAAASAPQAAVSAPQPSRKPTRAQAAEAVKRFGSSQAAITWLKDSGYDISGYAD